MQKNIAKQPKIKKKLAKFLAESYGLVPVDIQQDMLINGHRGYLAMTEKELTDLFDKEYEKLLADKKKREDTRDEHNHGSWEWAHYAADVEKVDKKIEQADEVYDSIFEEVFL